MLAKIILGVIGLTGAAATQCAADNCLRAIRASSRLARASVDCSAYIAITVTPPTVTYTAYSTTSELVLKTVEATLIDTAHDTSTSIIKDTKTIALTVTTVTTVYNPALKKRQVAPTIPTYASACSGAVRYKSACSCIGVPGPVTVTAPTPSTTITLPTTNYYSTETETLTVETVTTTLTDATIRITTIDATTSVTVATASATATVAYPALCKNIVLYNGLRPLDFSNLLTTDIGNLAYPECCLQCFLFPNCIAYVRYSGTCLLLRESGGGSNPPSPRCPAGVSNTIFGTANSGSVGKGPCDNPGPWN